MAPTRGRSPRPSPRSPTSRRSRSSCPAGPRRPPRSIRSGCAPIAACGTSVRARASDRARRRNSSPARGAHRRPEYPRKRRPRRRRHCARPRRAGRRLCAASRRRLGTRMPAASPSIREMTTRSCTPAVSSATSSGPLRSRLRMVANTCQSRRASSTVASSPKPDEVPVIRTVRMWLSRPRAVQARASIHPRLGLDVSTSLVSVCACTGR